MEGRYEMKRWAAISFIGVYLSALIIGLAAHTLNFGSGSHPVMYYLVWDMFCGWSSYAARVHVLGEGESGKFYELAPGPWGGFKPWGEMDRSDYDIHGMHCASIAMNTLKHSKHEPISRIFVIEESWAKKYDLPPVVWNSRFEEPQQKHTYCRVLVELTGDCQMLRSYPPWLSYLNTITISANPRLEEEAQRYRPLMMVDSPDPGRMRDLTLPVSGIRSPIIGGSVDAN